MRDTPIVIVGEGQGWMRLHMLARDFLLGRFERLPAARQHELHARAADWYAGRGLLREAARHALEAATLRPRIAMPRRRCARWVDRGALPRRASGSRGCRRAHSNRT